MAKKIVLAGGSGFIGQSLAARFGKRGYEVIILSRRRPSKTSSFLFVPWDGKTLGPWAEHLEGADSLINLAGRSVDCRYTERNKREIFDSRTEPTALLGKAVQAARKPPLVWINLSTATLYRHAEDRAMDEETGEIGSGFSVEVAKKWEKTFFESETPKTRKLALRSAIVLGPGGGVLGPFYHLVRFGLGGVQGKGRQRFSWIHEEDFFEIILFLRESQMSGAVNVCAPNALSNRDTMGVFRKAMHQPLGLPLPKLLIEIGAWLIRTEPELLLKSRWVIPTRLLQAGYRFRYPTLGEALATFL